MHNPTAGTGHLPEEELAAALRSAGHEAIYHVSRDEDALAEMERDPGNLVVAAGGDGTIARIAKRLIGRGVPVAVLPAGTANNLASAVGATTGFASQLAKLDQARQQGFDAGHARWKGGECRFLESVGGGLMARVIVKLDEDERQGKFSFESPEQEKRHVMGEMQELLRKARPTRWRVEADGRDLSGDYLLVEAMNIPAIGPGLKLAPEADVADGMLEVVLIGQDRRDELDEYVGLLILTYLGFRTVPTAFIPSQDTGYLLVNVQMPPAAALHRTDATMRQLARLANDAPGVEATFAVAGFSFVSGSASSNAGAMFVVLDPFAKRTGNPDLSATTIANRLRAKYAQVQDGQALVLPPPPVRGMGNSGGFIMQVQDRSGTASPQELQHATEQLIAASRQSPMVTGLFSTFRADVPQLQLNIDRLKLKQQGLQAADVFQTLQVFLGSLYVNDFNFLGRTYRVVAQADAAFRDHPEDVTCLQTRNASNQMVPLGSVLSVDPTSGPDRVGRYNLSPAADINGSAAPGISSGQALTAMEELAHQKLPPGYGFEWTGLAFQERQAANTAIFVFPLCVLFVWLVHSAEYESFAISTAIILIVPMCLLFAIGGVWLRNMDNNIFTQIGFVVLAGLSAKNAVLIVEFAKQQEEQGKHPFDAAIEAGRLRLRPILMTSFAFILGVLPLVWATGAGAEMRRALGTAVFFGMLGVTIFGIFLTPVFYISIRWLTGHRTPHAKR